MEIAIGTIAGTVLGFVGGLCAYTKSRRWCPACGAGLACVAAGCPAAGPTGPTRRPPTAHP